MHPVYINRGSEIRVLIASMIGAGCFFAGGELARLTFPTHVNQVPIQSGSSQSEPSSNSNAVPRVSGGHLTQLPRLIDFPYVFAVQNGQKLCIAVGINGDSRFRNLVFSIVPDAWSSVKGMVRKESALLDPGFYTIGMFILPGNYRANIRTDSGEFIEELNIKSIDKDVTQSAYIQKIGGPSIEFDSSSSMMKFKGITQCRDALDAADNLL